jgi:hypothetical protein
MGLTAIAGGVAAQPPEVPAPGAPSAASSVSSTTPAGAPPPPPPYYQPAPYPYPPYPPSYPPYPYYPYPPPYPPGAYRYPSPSAQPAPAASTTPTAAPLPILPYKRGMEVPDGYQVVARPRVPMAIAGGASLGASWIVGVVVAIINALPRCRSSSTGWGPSGYNCSSESTQELGLLALPLAGPWGSIGTGTLDDGMVALASVLGVTQAAGLGVLIVGMATGETLLVPKKASRAAPLLTVARGRFGEQVPTIGLAGSF